MSRVAVDHMLRPTSALNLALMRRIDAWRLEIPFMGARQRRRQLQREGVQVGRRPIGTLMQRRGIEAFGAAARHRGTLWVGMWCLTRILVAGLADNP
jgi:putative transposase